MVNSSLNYLSNLIKETNMQRYINNNKIKNTTIHSDSTHFNKIGFDSTILPNITRQPGDPVIIASSIDRLDLLANRFYKDVTKWWIIALANNLPGDSMFIESGKQIFIPKNITKIANDLSKKNNI